MNGSTMETLERFEDRFEVLDDALVYVDAPLEGFVRDKGMGCLFAFRVTTIVDDRLWHWTLIPVDDVGHVASIFKGFKANEPWLSVVEDHRGSPSVILVVRFEGGSAPLPRSVQHK